MNACYHCCKAAFPDYPEIWAKAPWTDKDKESLGVMGKEFPCDICGRTSMTSVIDVEPLVFELRKITFSEKTLAPKPGQD